MLAIQHRPGRMDASNQPNDTQLPFGYMPGDQGPDFSNPPEPVPGSALLSSREHQQIADFFSELGNDSYPMNVFGEGLAVGGDLFNNVLPPEYRGVMSSLGHAPGSFVPSHQLANGAFPDMIPMDHQNMMPPPPPPPAQQSRALQHRMEPHQVSQDVLAAAQQLAPRHGLSHMVSEHIYAPQDVQQPSLDPPVAALRHRSFEQHSRGDSMVPRSQPNTDHMFFLHLWQGDGTDIQLSSRRNPAGDVQYGTDTNFQAPGYIPRSHTETYHHITQQHLRNMDCLHIEPNTEDGPVHDESVERSSVGGHSRHNSEQARRSEGEEPPSRKRRRSRPTKSEDGDDDDEDAEEMKRPVRRRKSKAAEARPKATPSSPAQQDGSSAARRRKSANGTKPTRENLTEEQKRDNHIKSEQKRRFFIKEGFAQLEELVPGLKGNSQSKSTMLGTVADWIEMLLKDNEELRAQLDTLES